MPQLHYDELMDFEFAEVVPRTDRDVIALMGITLKANQYTQAKADRVVWEGYIVLGAFSIDDECQILQDILYGERV